MTEMGTVIGVRNATIMASATVGSNGLPLLPSGPIRLLCALLRRALSVRAALAALSVRCCSWLRFLRPLLRLGFLCVLLRLSLVLRRLSFSTASALFLVAFLCYCRNGGSEKQ